ncbi:MULTISPECIES: alpha/beta hydrolase [unclassified Spirosoma]|uniref:alpha/beta fold hydrolase n=1 Tax=unclassified Spirosoma TaxID=2621999 RepID=UPI000964EE20|nr:MULTISPECIES: alpha/beta hydrolase [unclassified Spirosoma]MBN8823616.1 alpha/beta hydrolase [Spirosoma sp.]OJW76825.1 MAG: alpha/beta hydrolase [Spirosoma sp. 48-14]
MSQSPVICLIHGHGVDASIWDSIYADLALETRVLKPDFAYLTSHHTIEAYAEDLYTQLQTAQVDQVVLVGHSMGGYIALAFAEQHPAMIHGLVLYHSTALADDENRKEVRRHAIEDLKTNGSAPFIQKQLPKMVAPDYPVDKTQQLIDRFIKLPADALIAGMSAMAGRPDRTHVLREATYPILLVLGRNDQIIAHDKAADLANLSDYIRIETIEDAGHLSMVEQPGESFQILKAFGTLC